MQQEFLVGMVVATLLALGCIERGGPERKAAAPPAAGVPMVVTDADFQQQVLDNSKPVMVDVWADWCEPCLKLAPTVDELAEDYKGRVVVAKLDYDANPGIPEEYGVEGFPTLLFFKNGKLVERLVGLQPKSRIARVLDSLIES